LLSLLAPFLLLPLIARVGSVSGWAALLLGQAIGSLGGVVAGLGWALVGPIEVARADDAAARGEVYARSLASRLLALIVLVPACGVVAYVLSPADDRWTAVAMSAAMTFGALSPAWFSIGLGRPSAIAYYEIVPRLVATGLAAVLVIALRQIWIYPVLLVIATVTGTALYGRRVANIRLRDIRAVSATRALWSTRSASATVSIAGSYSSTPVLVVGVVEAPQAVATFGSADRLYRLSLTVVQVLTNALQAWVAEIPVPPGRRLNRRMSRALVAHLALGVAGLAGFALLAPLATRILFGSPVATTLPVAVLFGVTFLAVALNSALGRLVLIPLGRTRMVLVSTAVGAATGLVAMSVLGAVAGGTGVATGFALSEVAVTVVQAWAVLAGRAPGPSAPTPLAEGASGLIAEPRP
jgi:O-antigen/teichoic acid export membrane protein